MVEFNKLFIPDFDGDASKSGIFLNFLHVNKPFGSLGKRKFFLAPAVSSSQAAGW